MSTLYWHDYETWGEVPAVDRPSQFAGIRTDEDLNIIGSPLMIYSQPTPDFIPKPDACLVTGLTPQEALEKGVPEPQFMATIHAELSIPGTCGVGYNTIRFDDEVTRYSLYRNFFDPYEREWRGGNSRWDIIDMVRLTRALRPEGIEWPNHDDGKPSFKLEHLTAANGFAHENAHDALADVHATIDVARLIKNKQPALYQHIYELRKKQKVAALVDLINHKPLLHISSMFPAENGCAAIVMPLCMHPTNKNGVVVFNLSVDPRPLLELNPEQIAERMFTKTADLPEGVERIPLKVVHLNKCPVLTTVKLLDNDAAQRLMINTNQCEQHWQQLKQSDLKALQKKIHQVFSEARFTESTDPEQQLYGGFLKDGDKVTCERVRKATAETFLSENFVFQDARLNAILPRYKARYFPETLTPQETAEWNEWRRERLLNSEYGAGMTIEPFKARIFELRAADLTPEKQEILSQLEQYVDGLLVG